MSSNDVVLENFLRGALAARPSVSATSWACAVASGDEVSTASGGIDSQGAATSSSTWFDLASLTKVLVTVPLAIRAFESGSIDPDAPINTLLPDRGWRWMSSHHNVGGSSMMMLLAHAAGAQPTSSIFTWGLSPQESILKILEMESSPLPNRVPQGHWTRSVYSDLGYIVLGSVLAGVANRPFRELAEEYLRSERLDGLSFTVPHGASVAGMGHCFLRGRELVGEVHDLNAFVLQDSASHAGLFGTLDGVLAALRVHSSVDHYERLSRTLAMPDSRHLDQSARGLGWETPSPGWSRGTFARQVGIAHVGSTGVNVWADGEGNASVLLSNRVGASDDAYTNEIASLRRSFAAVSDKVIYATR